MSLRNTRAQYCNDLVEEGNKESLEPSPDDNRKRELSSPASFTSYLSDLDGTQLLEPSRLLDIMTKKSSFQGSFISILEIQARNRALKHCRLAEEDYLVLFIPNYKDALMMIGESYHFFRGNFYMTVINEELDRIWEFATQKKSKVVSTPESWLDLKIKGSQLSQYFRRKCKHSPKGLFFYPLNLNGTRYSLHWISEAHRNSWHVLLDATGLVFRDGCLALALHRPDFVLCLLDNTHGQTIHDY